MALRKHQRRDRVRWEARWKDPQTRKDRSRSFDTKREAEAFLASVKTSQMQGSYVDPSLGRTTLEQWWRDRYLPSASHLKASTRDRYCGLMDKQVLPYLGRSRLGALGRLEVEGWVTQLGSEGTSAATTAAAHRVLRLVLQSACNAGVIAKNPASRVRTPRAPRQEMRFLTVEEVDAIAARVPPRYRALVLTLAWAGLRIGEAAALKVDKLDLLHGRIQVTEAYAEVRGELILGATKNYEHRAVTLPKSLASDLSRHLEDFPPRGGLVFSGPEGGAIRHSGFRHRVWVPAVKVAGIEAPRPRIHDLRHTCVALALAAGAHPKEIQARLGHSSITVTLDRYGHLFPSQDEALAAQMDALRAAQASQVGWKWDASTAVEQQGAGDTL